MMEMNCVITGKVRKSGRLSQDLDYYFRNAWTEIVTRCTASVRCKGF